MDLAGRRTKGPELRLGQRLRHSLTAETLATRQPRKGVMTL